MARLTEHGLRRSVGVPGLFATAYGNVGSSIYYALGLVAAHALGLTPLVFMFAGGLFALTAKTYAEGAAMFPEAGLLLVCAPRLQRARLVLRRLGAQPGLHPHDRHLGVLRTSLPERLSGSGRANHNPGDIFGGLIVIVALAGLNIRGLGESAKLNFVLAIVDLSTQVLLVAVGAVLVLDPSLLIHQVHLGTVPSWHELIFALSLAMLAYTASRRSRTWPRRHAIPARRCPRRSISWCSRCSASTWASR